MGCQGKAPASMLDDPDALCKYYAELPGCCPDVIVAKDGSGDFTSVQEAINSLRTFKPEGRARVFIKKGVYEEKITVQTHRSEVSLIGEDRDETIIIWHDHANMPGENGFPMGTFQTWTMRVEGPDFICANLTIANDAMTYNNPGWFTDRKDNAGVGQAVALHVEADRAIFANCKFLGFQDTIYTGNPDGRELYVNCHIEGTVDFIFGPATCWFENCTVKALRSKGYYTAASTPQDHKFGYIFNRCTITDMDDIEAQWLGRPWRNYAYTLFKECDIQADVNPLGWHNWNDPARELTARYLEYKCTGPGSDRSERVAWSRELTEEEAAEVTLENAFYTPSTTWAPVPVK